MALEIQFLAKDRHTNTAELSGLMGIHLHLDNLTSCDKTDIDTHKQRALNCGGVPPANGIAAFPNLIIGYPITRQICINITQSPNIRFSSISTHFQNCPSTKMTSFGGSAYTDISIGTRFVDPSFLKLFNSSLLWDVFIINSVEQLQTLPKTQSEIDISPFLKTQENVPQK
jgi:hypothetical protein